MHTLKQCEMYLICLKKDLAFNTLLYPIDPPNAKRTTFWGIQGTFVEGLKAFLLLILEEVLKGHGRLLAPGTIGLTILILILKKLLEELRVFPTISHPLLEVHIISRILQKELQRLLCRATPVPILRSTVEALLVEKLLQRSHGLLSEVAISRGVQKAWHD